MSVYKMFELENIIDLVIGAQYVVSSSQGLEEITERLAKVKPFLNTDGLTVEFLLRLLVVSLPVLLCDEGIVKCVESLLEVKEQHDFENHKQGEDVDISSILGTESEVPATITNLLGLSLEQKKMMVEKLYESITTETHRYNFSVQDDGNMITDAKLFSMCMKSFIFRINYDLGSFRCTDVLISAIKHSRFADLELLDWIKGFYSPMSRLSKTLEYDHPLLDYENLLPTEEKVQLIMTHITKEKKDSGIINEVLIPYFQYVGIDAWNSLNIWLQEFGSKCIKEADHLKLINNYKVLLYLLRHDKLLLALDSLEYTVKATFVCTILATIYLCPRAVLQVFVYSKEMLTLLKYFNLEDGPDVFSAENLSGLTLSEVSHKLSASYKTIDSILNVIDVGEILYSNELSFVDIMTLENSNKSVQYTELVKFIDNEVTVETNDKKWSLFLSSLYATFKKTSVFNKISIEELCEVILGKLLGMKQYSVIANIYQISFNHLLKDNYENIIAKHCWQLYMKARNCDPKIGSLKDCANCLKLLSSTSGDAHRLSSLIEANSKLLEWKFYLKPGVPITPKNVFEVDDPLAIIKRILELNENAYMYPGDLYYLLALLVDGMDKVSKDSLYLNKGKSYDDPTNLLVVKLRLLCLEFSSAMDYSYSFDLGFELLAFAITRKYEVEGLFELVSENWFLFFQLSKNDYDNVSESSAVNNKMKLLGKLLLLTPTEFNTIVLEQWQMLNSQQEQMMASSDISQQVQQKSSTPIETSLGDVQARLQRSLKSSAEELLNTDSSELGKNIIGWIVGAN